MLQNLNNFIIKNSYLHCNCVGVMKNYGVSKRIALRINIYLYIYVQSQLK